MICVSDHKRIHEAVQISMGCGSRLGRSVDEWTAAGRADRLQERADTCGEGLENAPKSYRAPLPPRFEVDDRSGTAAI